MIKQKGATLVLVIMFSMVFLTLLGGIVSLILNQYKISQQKAAWDLALHIAEAGVNYYKWHLAHSPSDFCDGKTPGVSGCQTVPYGPFEHEYKDPEGNTIGRFSLTITPSSNCCSATIIESKGWVLNYPSLDRIVKIWWGKPSLARYAFLTNSNVWFGADESLKGPFFSNGGIRMDGQQNSLSSSAQTKYICESIHGCSRTNCSSPCTWKSTGCECPGIWGQGSGQGAGLWSFPVSTIDFELIRRNLSDLQQKATAANLYFGPSGNKYYGYHIKFLSNGQYSLYKVSSLKSVVWGWNGTAWVNESNDIDKETLIGTYNLPTTCAPMFFEDNVWVNGDVKGKVTLVAAKLPESSSSLKKIIIHDNINYVDDNSNLGLIAQGDILIAFYAPSNLNIKATMLAQNGRVFRYDYPNWSYDPYLTYSIRNSISTYGAIITNQVWTFTWVDGSGDVISGYRTTNMNYNPNLTFDPPPYFPTSGDYDIFRWEEK